MSKLSALRYKKVAMVTWYPTVAHLWCSHAMVKHTSHIVLGIGFKLLSPGFHWTSPNNQHYLLLWSSLDNVPLLLLLNKNKNKKKKKKHSVNIISLTVHCILNWHFHTILQCFALWRAVVEPSIIPIEDTSQEIIPFIFIMFQNTVTDARVCTCVLLWNAWELILHKLYECLAYWGWSYDLQMSCYFIKRHPSIIQNHGTGLFNVLISSGHAQLSQLFCISYVCVIIFELNNPNLHTLLPWITVPTLYWESSMDLCPWYTWSPQKLDY